MVVFKILPCIEGSHNELFGAENTTSFLIGFPSYFQGHSSVSKVFPPKVCFATVNDIVVFKIHPCIQGSHNEFYHQKIANLPSKVLHPTFINLTIVKFLTTMDLTMNSTIIKSKFHLKVQKFLNMAFDCRSNFMRKL